MVKGDAQGLAPLLSDELYYGHSGGTYDNKASFLAKFSAGDYCYQAVETQIDKAQLIGTEGLVINGQVHIKVTLHGQPADMYSIYVAVWKKEDGQWKFVAHQTAIKKKT